MKIAAITITYNDEYKIKEWAHWYEEYKDELYKLIIVDNGSRLEYLHLVETIFKDATIIQRNTNGGCTSAYNDGIRKALEDDAVTHIALIGNDMRIEKGALKKCVELLESDTDLGMVAPVILNADSDIVANYGCSISQTLSMIQEGNGMKLSEIEDIYRICDAVAGGMNVSKRSFYESSVGLQDEKLFMYSDEVDMALRAKKAAVQMATTKEAVSWHQHINPPGNNRRHPFSNYLIARNKVYLGKKHFGTRKQLSIFGNFFFLSIFHFLKYLIRFKWDQLIYPYWTMIGAWNGLIGNMKENKYSKIEGTYITKTNSQCSTNNLK